MLFFPDGIDGRLPLDEGTDVELVLNRVEALLLREGRSVAERGANYVTFKDPFWGEGSAPARWPIFAIYNQGRFEVQSTTRGLSLHYRVSRPGLLAFCLATALVAFLFGRANGGVPEGLLYAAFAFGSLFGVNVCLGFARLPTAIRAAVRDGATSVVTKHIH